MNDSKTLPAAVGRFPKLFYGWWILLGVAVISFVIALVNPGELATLRGGIEGSFLESDPIYRTNRSWPRVHSLLMPLVSSLVLAPVVGFLLDRYGPRTVMLFLILITGSAFLLMSRVQNEWQMDAAFWLISGGTSSITSVVLISTLGKWFVHKRVLAFAVVSICSTFALMFSFLPIFVITFQMWQIYAILAGTTLLMVGIPAVLMIRNQPEWFLRKRVFALAVVAAGAILVLIFSVATLLAFGSLIWQITAIVVGGTILMVGIPVALMMRRQPEDHGLLPDGVAEHGNRARREISATARSALRIPAFWQLVIAGGLVLGTMPALQLDPRNLGFHDTILGDIFQLGYLGIFLEMVGVATVGLISLRLRKRILILVSFVLVAVTQSVIVVIYLVDTFPFEFLAYLIFSGIGSVSGTAIRLFMFALLADYLGRRNFGAIVGITIAVNGVISILAPIAFYPFSYFASGIMGFNLTQYGLGMIAIAAAAFMILKLEPRSRVAARIWRANHSLYA